MLTAKRIGVLALASFWFLGAVAGIGWVVFVSSFGDLWCAHSEGDSNFGKLRWSLLPPGHTCTWTERANGFDDVEGPGWQGSTYIVGMALVGGATVVAVRRARDIE